MFLLCVCVGFLKILGYSHLFHPQHSVMSELHVTCLPVTGRIGEPRSFTVKRLPMVESLCPVVTLEAYEKVTQPFRVRSLSLSWLQGRDFAPTRAGC